MEKEMIDFVVKNFNSVNDAIDYLENSIEEYIDNKIESELPMTEQVILFDAWTLSRIKGCMSNCEDKIEQIAKILLKYDNLECEDLDRCNRMYFECSNRYEKFKLTTYQLFLSYNYFKYETKIEKGEHCYE